MSILRDTFQALYACAQTRLGGLGLMKRSSRYYVHAIDKTTFGIYTQIGEKEGAEKKGPIRRRRVSGEWELYMGSMWVIV